MRRRDFLKQAATVTVAGAFTPLATGEIERSYESPTISVRLVDEGEPGITSIYLTEHGNADQAIVEAFYYTKAVFGGTEARLMLHKEATTPVVKGVGCATSIALPIADIIFLRVKRMRLLAQSEFGSRP